MVFEFRIWGLFLLFLLVTISSLRRNIKLSKNNFYFILVTSYILEFFYIICFMMNKILLTRIYFMLLIIVFSLYTFYFMQVILEEKYIMKEKEKKLTFIKEIIAIMDIVLIIITYLINDSHIFTYIITIGILSSLLNLILLIAGRKNISKEKYNILLGFIFIELILFIFQIEFIKIEIIQSLIILLTTYLYITLENPDKKEVEDLKIEKEYSTKNMIEKQEFLKKLSHEIRIPINSIDGFSQIMMVTEDIKEIKEEAKDIRVASHELIDLINSMIDLSILESGELKIIKENYNIYDTLKDFTEMIPSRLKSKNVAFNVDIEKNIPEVLLGDADRIQQIILNVISNSIKYTDKGNIKLEVRSVKSNSICRLIIKVIDTGKGMSQEEIHHLLDDEEKGIGLKIANYLLELMNGKLEIESTVDKGTCVTITIDQEIVSLKENKKNKKNTDIQIVSFKEKRVLLVDDNKLNLKVATKLLTPYEVEIVSVTSGKECLDLLDQDHQFDLILMDDMMPNMSGVETLDILRKIERVSGFYIPVVALTANAVSGVKEKYINHGFDDYLSKPIEREELDRVLKEFLK